MPAASEFEHKIFELLREHVRDGKLGLLPSACEVFLHRRYFSPDRKDYIITDVSIEVSVLPLTEPVLLWIWECKNYRHKVDVSDIEEFHAKLEQIGADKTKGTMITSSAYQPAALQYAKTKGIGLVRCVEAARGTSLFDSHDGVLFPRATREIRNFPFFGRDDFGVMIVRTIVAVLTTDQPPTRLADYVALDSAGLPALGTDLVFFAKRELSKPPLSNLIDVHVPVEFHKSPMDDE
jgi:hypothetical protein